MRKNTCTTIKQDYILENRTLDSLNPFTTDTHSPSIHEPYRHYSYFPAHINKKE